MTGLQCLSEHQVRELDRLCAEVAQNGYGRVVVHIENGHPRFLEKATTTPIRAPGHDPPEEREMK